MVFSNTWSLAWSLEDKLFCLSSNPITLDQAQVLQVYQNVSATTKLFVLFCSAQLVSLLILIILSTTQRMAKFWWNAKVYNKGIFVNSGCFFLIWNYCFDFEWSDVINFVVSCSVVELFIRREHKKSSFQWLNTPQTTLLLKNCSWQIKCSCVVVLGAL